jgi:hypothetical protein
MADATDIAPDNTQSRNPASLEECEAEIPSIVGVGGTTTDHLANTSDSRKRVCASSPRKVGVHQNVCIRYTRKMLTACAMIGLECGDNT